MVIILYLAEVLLLILTANWVKNGLKTPYPLFCEVKHDQHCLLFVDARPRISDNGSSSHIPLESVTSEARCLPLSESEESEMLT